MTLLTTRCARPPGSSRHAARALQFCMRRSWWWAGWMDTTAAAIAQEIIFGGGGNAEQVRQRTAHNRTRRLCSKLAARSSLALSGIAGLPTNRRGIASPWNKSTDLKSTAYSLQPKIAKTAPRTKSHRDAEETRIKNFARSRTLHL